MKNLLKMEWFQLLHNRVFQCMVLLIFLLGFVMSDSYLSDTYLYQGAARTILSFFDGIVYDSTFLLIILSVVMALLLGQEFSGRTINREVCAGHSRSFIFISKTVVYLSAFNLLAVVYPLVGSLKQFRHFKEALSWDFVKHITAASLYSFLLNTVLFLIPVFFCFLLRNMAKAVAATAFLTFTIALYLGYGTMLGLPLKLLPVYQIREVIMHSLKPSAACFISGLGGIILLFTPSLVIFRKAELK